MAVASSQISEIGQLVDQYGLTLCVECGKCVAACPMATIFDDFTYEVSPRGVIEALLVDQDAEAILTDRLWFCLTCDLCTELCPAGVQFRDFVQASRHYAIELGVTERMVFCSNCGAYLQPRRIMKYLNETLGEVADDLRTLCPRCRQYNYAGKVKSPGLRGGKEPYLLKESGASR